MYSLLKFIRMFAGSIGLAAFSVVMLFGSVYPTVAIPSIAWIVMSILFGFTTFAIITALLVAMEYWKLRKTGLHYVIASHYDMTDMLAEFREMGILEMFLGGGQVRTDS